MSNTTDSAIVGLIHKYDGTDKITRDLLFREVPEAFWKDGFDFDFTTTRPAIEDAFLHNREDFAVNRLVDRLAFYNPAAVHHLDPNTHGIPYLLHALRAFTKDKIVPYSRLTKAARNRYEDIARRMLYPDLRMSYRDHEVLVNMLARNLYYLEKEDKLQGGSLD